MEVFGSAFYFISPWLSWKLGCIGEVLVPILTVRFPRVRPSGTRAWEFASLMEYPLQRCRTLRGMMRWTLVLLGSWENLSTVQVGVRLCEGLMCVNVFVCLFVFVTVTANVKHASGASCDAHGAGKQGFAME